MATPQGAEIEILEFVGSYEDFENLRCIKPTRVLINGTDVGLIASESISIDPGDARRVASVTLTLLPKRIVVGAEIGDEP